VVFAIQYLRKGGSISGLVNAEKDTLTSLSKMLPITDAQRTKITSMVQNTKKLIPTSIQKAIEQKLNPEETAPEETAPEETVPEETVPVETTPSEQVIVETTPSEQVPVDDLQILAPVTSTPAVLRAKPTTTSTILNPTPRVKPVSKPTLSIPPTILSKPTITATQKPIQRPGQTPKKPASVPTVVASLVVKNPEPTTLDTTPPLIHELNLPTVSEPEDSKIPILVRPEDRAHVEAFLKSRQKM